MFYGMMWLMCYWSEWADALSKLARVNAGWNKRLLKSVLFIAERRLVGDGPTLRRLLCSLIEKIFLKLDNALGLSHSNRLEQLKPIILYILHDSYAYRSGWKGCLGCLCAAFALARWGRNGWWSCTSSDCSLYSAYCCSRNNLWPTPTCPLRVVSYSAPNDSPAPSIAFGLVTDGLGPRCLGFWQKLSAAVFRICYSLRAIR